MHLRPEDTIPLEAVVNDALRLGGLVLMKNVNLTRNIGKSPALVFAESIIAAYRMQQNLDDGGPAA
jgi:hypothetical protein